MTHEHGKYLDGMWSPLHADTDRNRSRLSPYITFSRDDWKKLRNNTPLTLTAEDLEAIRGINERISLSEVEEIYLPLSRLLNIYYLSARELYASRKEFLGTRHERIPFIIGVAGSVAVGKSTISRLLKTMISAWPQSPRVELIPTDGFLYNNRILEERGLTNRKGFPESYDLHSLLRFLFNLKSGLTDLNVPIYSHMRYDIVPGEFHEVHDPDIVILEGLNVLQTRSTRGGNAAEFFVSDFFDFSVYIDAQEPHIKSWFIDRFKVLMNTAFKDSSSFFHSYSYLSEDEAVRIAGQIWDTINAVNLKENIEPSKFHAHLILEKMQDHSIGQVMMRRI